MRHNRSRWNVLGMQDFVFAQIQANLTKSNHFFPNITSILPKSNHLCSNFALILPKSKQICSNLTKFAQKNFAWGSSRIPISYGTEMREQMSWYLLVQVTLIQSDADWLKNGARWLSDKARVAAALPSMWLRDALSLVKSLNDIFLS